jgi:hypothetical protein
MSYVAAQLLEVGGDVILEDLMADLCKQAEDQAKEWAHSAFTSTPYKGFFPYDFHV